VPVTCRIRLADPDPRGYVRAHEQEGSVANMAIAIRSNGQISYPFLFAGAFTPALAVRETRPVGAPRY